MKIFTTKPGHSISWFQKCNFWKKALSPFWGSLWRRLPDTLYCNCKDSSTCARDSSVVGWSRPFSNVLLTRHQHFIEATSRSVTHDTSQSHVRQLLLYHHVLSMQNIYHIIISRVKSSYWCSRPYAELRGLLQAKCKGRLRFKDTLLSVSSPKLNSLSWGGCYR